jgi:hypothetical protein
VDVLRDAIGIVPRHHGLDVIGTLAIGRHHRAVLVALDVVVPEMIRLPDLQRRVGTGLAARVVDRAGDDERQPGIARRAQRGAGRRAAPIERPELVLRRRCLRGLLGGEQRLDERALRTARPPSARPSRRTCKADPGGTVSACR